MLLLGLRFGFSAANRSQPIGVYGGSASGLSVLLCQPLAGFLKRWQDIDTTPSGVVSALRPPGFLGQRCKTSAVQIPSIQKRLLCQLAARYRKRSIPGGRTPKLRVNIQIFRWQLTGSALWRYTALDSGRRRPLGQGPELPERGSGRLLFTSIGRATYCAKTVSKSQVLRFERVYYPVFPYIVHNLRRVELRMAVADAWKDLRVT